MIDQKKKDFFYGRRDVQNNIITTTINKNYNKKNLNLQEKDLLTILETTATETIGDLEKISKNEESNILLQNKHKKGALITDEPSLRTLYDIGGKKLTKKINKIKQIYDLEKVPTEGLNWDFMLKNCTLTPESTSSPKVRNLNHSL